jgi:cytochrome c-type biogenesis protein CcmH/NrfG
MEPEAEANCDSLITRAIGVAPTDTEVQLTLASIRMSQSRFEEAKNVVMGVYERIADLDACKFELSF